MKKLHMGIVALLVGIVTSGLSHGSNLQLIEGASVATSSSSDILASSTAAGANSDVGAAGSASSTGKKTGSAGGMVAFCIDDAGIDFAVNGACTMGNTK
jgi:hypothetical protein